MAIYSGFTHWKWWFSIAMLVYQRVRSMSIHETIRKKPPFKPLKMDLNLETSFCAPPDWPQRRGDLSSSRPQRQVKNVSLCLVINLAHTHFVRCFRQFLKGIDVKLTWVFQGSDRNGRFWQGARPSCIVLFLKFVAMYSSKKFAETPRWRYLLICGYIYIHIGGGSLTGSTPKSSKLDHVNPF